MVFFTSIKKSMILISLTYIALGLMLFMQDQFTLDQMFIVMAMGFGISGLLSIIRYFLIKVSERIKRDDFIIGAILVTFAILIYIYRLILAEVFDLFGVFAIMMIISCYFKLEDMLDCAATGKSAYSAYLVMIVLTLIFAAVTYFANFDPISIQFCICGAGLVFAGVTDIVSNFMLAGKVYSFEKRLKEANKQEVKAELPEVKDEPYIEQVEEVKEEPIAQEEVSQEEAEEKKKD